MKLRNLQSPLTLLALLLLAQLAACGAGSTTAPASQPALIFATITHTIKDQSFTIEVADTDDKRQLGLMNRPSLPKNHGMLFVFDKPDYYSFWMKNTLIPLDLVYLDESGKVVDIHPLKPKDETAIEPAAPAKFALELNAGTCKTLSLTLGNTLKLPESLTPKPNADKPN